MTPTGKIKRAAPHILANWVSAAWKRIVKSFNKCSISSALEGSEDDVLWNDTEDGGERGNESIFSGHNSDDSEYDE